MYSNICKKKRFLAPMFCFISIAVLTGCAGREKPILSLSAKQSMQSARLVVVNDNSKIGADIEGSNSMRVMGGGLLWALADVAVKAEQKNSQSNVMAPVTVELEGLNLLSDMKTGVSRVADKSNKFEFVGDEISSEKVETYIKENRDGFDSIGILTPKYQFSEDFASLRTSIIVKFIPTSTTFKTALGVSEAFDDSVGDTVVQYISKPENTLPSLPNDRKLKSKVKEKLVDKLLFVDVKDKNNLIKSEMNRLRLLNKKKNIEVWSAYNGKEIKAAIDQSTTLIMKKLEGTLSVMFPNGIKNVQSSKAKTIN